MAFKRSPTLITTVFMKIVTRLFNGQKRTCFNPLLAKNQVSIHHDCQFVSKIEKPTLKRRPSTLLVIARAPEEKKKG